MRTVSSDAKVLKVVEESRAPSSNKRALAAALLADIHEQAARETEQATASAIAEAERRFGALLAKAELARAEVDPSEAKSVAHELREISQSLLGAVKAQHGATLAAVAEAIADALSKPRDYTFDVVRDESGRTKRLIAKST